MSEIVDANTIRRASNIYVGRPSSRQSYDLDHDHHHAATPPPVTRVHAPSSKNSAFSSCSSWWRSSAETKRKKRVARYKLYTVEGRFKASLKHGFRWIKNTSSRIVHGHRGF